MCHLERRLLLVFSCQIHQWDRSSSGNGSIKGKQQKSKLNVLLTWFSHNAGVNYANRNASQHTPVSKFLLGYLGAVSVSVSIAVWLYSIEFIGEKLIWDLIRLAWRWQLDEQKDFHRQWKQLYNVLFHCLLLVNDWMKFVLLIFELIVVILACASTCNVLFMRFHEIYDGIEVIDEENKPIGVSKIAAKKVSRFEIDWFHLSFWYLGVNRNGYDPCISTRTYSFSSTDYNDGLWKVEYFLFVFFYV